MSVRKIVEGTLNNILSINDGLYKERMEICRSCKLMKRNDLFGEMCDKTHYLNPETNQVSKEPKDGFFKGCGCVLASKTRVPEMHCPAGKW